MDTSGELPSLPTSHPSWCDVSNHQAMLDGLVDPDPADVRKHWAMGGEGLLLELRWAHRLIRDYGGSWVLSIEQQPLDDDESGAGGWPFIQLSVIEPGRGDEARLTLTEGEARVLAAQLLEVADRVDRADG